MKWTKISGADLMKALDQAEEIVRDLQEVRKGRTGTHPLAFGLAGASLIRAFCNKYEGDPAWFIELLTTGDMSAFLNQGPRQ
jgi:hypothetical protein